jgi:hypothetical protein
VAKRADSRYEDNPIARNWIKVKNPAYSQKEGEETCSSERANSLGFRFKKWQMKLYNGIPPETRPVKAFAPTSRSANRKNSFRFLIRHNLELLKVKHPQI